MVTVCDPGYGYQPTCWNEWPCEPHSLPWGEMIPSPAPTRNDVSRPSSPVSGLPQFPTLATEASKEPAGFVPEETPAEKPEKPPTDHRSRPALDKRSTPESGQPDKPAVEPTRTPGNATSKMLHSTKPKEPATKQLDNPSSGESQKREPDVLPQANTSHTRKPHAADGETVVCQVSFRTPMTEIQPTLDGNNPREGSLRVQLSAPVW